MRRWIMYSAGLGLLLALAVAASGAAQEDALGEDPGSEATSWTVYVNTLANYSLEYPSDWSVTEQGGASDERLVTTFAPPDGGSGITVTVAPADTDEDASLDLPNRRCEEVTLAGLSGRRCFETLSLTTSTTLFGSGRRFVISARVRGLDPAVYEHVLATFSLLGGQTSEPGAAPAAPDAPAPPAAPVPAPAPSSPSAPEVSPPSGAGTPSGAGARFADAEPAVPPAGPVRPMPVLPGGKPPLRPAGAP